ncbi:MAG: DUF2586 domain-containing protein [Thermodesulfobacteriota bacterium]|nr:DUF2586 domain-containing protein [Thermodesulfobacteriota bacterium]
MGDVLEFLIDGTSGLAPGGVEGAAIVAGVCSTGTVGQGYLLGKSSDLEGLLGVGPLVDRLRDVFAAGGQSPVVIAVPVTGQAAGYFTPVVQSGTGPAGAASGSPASNADAVVEILTGGALETATYRVSEDGGTTWGDETTTPANGQVAIGSTGVTITLEAGTHVSGDTYSTTIRVPIGPVAHTGTGPDIALAGTVAAAAEVQLQIVSGGTRNEGTYKLSVDGGDNWGAAKTIPADGDIVVGSTGVTITVPDSPDMVTGDVYAFDLMAPVPSMTDVMTALETPLSLYDVEFVYVVGPSDSVDWAAMGTKADELWNAHRPTFFLAESRLPYDNEGVNGWTAALVADKQGYSHRFVAVCSAFGEVTDTTGKRIVRSWAGLVAGRILATPVMRAIGRVRDGGISQGALPSSFTEAMQQQLETAGFITAKYYAGLSSPYWGDGKTLADVTSDYQYLEVLRVVFKAVRKARIAALKSMYDEAGDVILGADAAGLAYLQANIETALNTLKAAMPTELADYVVTIPDGQDIVNNGVAVEMELIGIPIIRSIKLFAKYIYAGSTFDPRLEG